MSWELDLDECADLVDAYKEKRGRKFANYGLTENERNRIKQSALPYERLMELYNVSSRTIASIRRGSNPRKLKPGQAEEIRTLRRTHSLRQLAERYGVSQSHISKICKGHNWREVPTN